MSQRHFIKHLPYTKNFSSFAHPKPLPSQPKPSQPQLSHTQMSQTPDPHSLLKDDPIQILSSLWSRSFSLLKPSSPPFANLTGFLSNLSLYVLAYQRATAHFTGSFPSTHSISSNTLLSLLLLRNSIVSSKFNFNSPGKSYGRNPSGGNARAKYPDGNNAFGENPDRKKGEDTVFNDRIVRKEPYGRNTNGNNAFGENPYGKNAKDIVFQDRIVRKGSYGRNPDGKNVKDGIFIRNPDNSKGNDGGFQDRVVQEVLLMVLEPVFEPRFSRKSHGFRPGRNPHTAIRTIRTSFAGYLWFVKGDLSEVFENVDTDLLMGCVKKGVKDKKVLNLIRMAAMENLAEENEPEKGKEEFGRRKKKRKKKKKTILSENEPKPDPYWLRVFYSFAPEEALKVPNYGCCGILSPLLANICLSELDYVMEEKIVEFFKPSKLDSIWRGSIDEGSHNPSWPEFVPSSGKERTRKMDYIRYGGHFLIGIRGPREEAVRIRQELIEFCEMKYGIKLDYSKMQIEHISRGVQFLDHKISLRVIHPTLRYTGTGGEITSKKGVGTLLSVTACLEQCIRKLRKIELLKGDKDPEPMPCNPMIYSGQAHTNVQMNKLLETMADWYRYADNRKKVIAFFAYVIRSSVAKLYAARYRMNSRAKVYKVATRDLSRPLRRRSNRSTSEHSDLLRMGLVEAIEGVRFSQMSMIPSCDYTPFPRNWVPNHERLLHEYLRLQDPKNFCELNKIIKNKGLSVPQEEISEILWTCKTLGVWSLYSDFES